MKGALPTVWALAGAVCFLAPNVQAGPIVNQTYSGTFPATITGTLPNQGTALEETFALPTAENLTITTTSYAGGGFEPNLLLFDSTGKFVASGIPFGAPASATGIIGDMQLKMSNLPSGMYTLALTDFLLNQSLTATNLSDGFTVNYGSGTTFADSNGNARTGNYSFTIAAASTAAVPEPATLWLAAPFVAALALRAKKRLL